jgi:hypothetical protein
MMMSEQNETTKAELMSRNERAYQDLMALIEPLNDEQLSRPTSSGWTIKDHLGHLAAWQIGIVALLQRQPRFAAMGVPEGDHEKLDLDEINDRIQKMVSVRSAAELRAALEDAHQQMQGQINVMTAADFDTPYRDFMPPEHFEGAEGGSQDPILNWIIGNSYDHYNEHLQYVRREVEEILG